MISYRKFIRKNSFTYSKVFIITFFDTENQGFLILKNWSHLQRKMPETLQFFFLLLHFAICLSFYFSVGMLYKYTFSAANNRSNSINISSNNSKNKMLLKKKKKTHTRHANTNRVAYCGHSVTFSPFFQLFSYTMFNLQYWIIVYKTAH